MKTYLTIRYLLALALVALLAMVSFFASRQIIASNTHGAALINLSGQQRMLSQRIALLTMRMIAGVHPEDRRWSRRNLVEAADQMDAVHERLMGRSDKPGFPAPISRELKDFYFGGDDPLDSKVLDYLTLVREILATPDGGSELSDKRLQLLLGEGMGGLLDRLDVAVRLYQQESEEKVALLNTIQVASSALMLLLLVFVALFIFRPMVERIVCGQERLEELNARLGELAVKDSLTGCWNRRKFEEIIEREINTAKRYQSPLSLLFLDIDHFKHINDSLGHNIGDLVLAGLVGVVQGHIRVSDYLVRWGGEEFILLLPATKLEAASKVAEKLRQDVEHARFAEGVAITVSLGVALHEPGEDAESLVKRADCALYQAKSNGRNRVEAAERACPES